VHAAVSLETRLGVRVNRLFHRTLPFTLNI
jgi:hypothetical protein